MSKHFLLTIFFILLISFIIQSICKPQLVFADGMVFKPDPYLQRWDYSDETSQQAFINYENGIERMIISVGLNQTDSDLYWIFPVPANPEKVEIDIVKTLPSFNGEDINLTAQKNLKDSKEFLQFTQIYPSLVQTFFGTTLMNVDVNQKAPGFGAVERVDFSGGQEDVVVFEHMEKEGITTEIVTAKTPLGLAEYFENKGFKFESQSVRALNHYIGKEFTFVVSWITKKSPNTLLKSNTSLQRGIFVTFPTDKIYYPLIPTSVYGNKIVPASLRIVGHVSPEIFDDIKSYTDVKYYIDGNFLIDAELNGFLTYRDRELPYTLIKIDSPSSLLSNDLWISKSVPLKTYAPSFISKHPYITTGLLLIICSFITGVLTGWLVIKEARNIKGSIKYGLIGLSNCLTIIGLTATVIFFGNRKISFIPLFSINFLIISWILIKVIEFSF